jgi:hypothetical protein
MQIAPGTREKAFIALKNLQKSTFAMPYYTGQKGQLRAMAFLGFSVGNKLAGP